MNTCMEWHVRGLASAIAFASLGSSPAFAMPLISELYYDADGSDNGKGFVELHGPPGLSLDGFVIEGINGSNGEVVVVIELAGEILDGGLYLVADVDGDGATEVPGADLLANFDFQNGPDSVWLRNGEAVLDALGYGDFGPMDIFSGEGLPAPDAPSGSSLARLFANVDTDDNANDFAVAIPSPGVAEVQVPEPGAALLTFAALGLVGVLRRRR